MKITHYYERKEDYLEGEYVIDTAVGMDTGTTNFGTGRMSRLAPNDRYVVENLAIIDLHGENRKEDIDTIGENMRRLFSQSNMQWFWEPPSPVTSERQLDGIKKFNSWKKPGVKAESGDTTDDENSYKPPIMFAIYGMMQQLVCARADPVLFLSDEIWDELLAKGITPESLKNEGIVWVPRSGIQKSYLDGIRGKERKQATLTAGPQCCRDNDDEAAALFLESMPRQKPQEDGCDIVLQIHHYLEERRKKEAKEEAKEARVVAAETKRDEKAQKAIEREEKARQRKEAAERKAKEKEDKKRERERKREEKEVEKVRKQQEKEARKAEKEEKKTERQRKKAGKLSKIVNKARGSYEREMDNVNGEDNEEESTDDIEVRIVKDHSSNKRKREEVEADEEDPMEVEKDGSDPREASEEEPISERPTKRQKTVPQTKVTPMRKTGNTPEDDSNDLIDFDIAQKLLG